MCCNVLVVVVVLWVGLYLLVCWLLFAVCCSMVGLRCFSMFVVVCCCGLLCLLLLLDCCCSGVLLLVCAARCALFVDCRLLFVGV